MQVNIVKTLKEFELLKNEWIEIEKNNSEVSYYSTFNYNYNWLKAYLNNKINLFTIVIYNNKKIIGIAPLIIEKRTKLKLKYRVLKFMGKGDFFNFIIDNNQNNYSAIIKEIFKTIENNNEWDKLILTQISQKSKLAEYIFRNDRYNKYFSPIVECPCLRLSDFNSFDEYKKRFKIDKECKYYLNRMKKNINFKFKVINSKYENIYDKLKALHIKEQEYLKKEKNRNERGSVFQGNENDSFFRNIFLNNENNITFLIEDENNQIISYYNCYVFNGKIHFWNTGYDFNYIKYTPSKIVNYLMFEYMYNNNMTNYIFDFGAGRYPWKFKWTNEFNMIYKFEMINKYTNKGKIFSILK